MKARASEDTREDENEGKSKSEGEPDLVRVREEGMACEGSRRSWGRKRERDLGQLAGCAAGSE